MDNSTPMKAIKAFCLQCSGDNYQMMKTCTAPNCPLYPYRTGVNTLNKRELSEEQKQAAKERMQKYWEEKRNEQ